MSCPKCGSWNCYDQGVMHGDDAQPNYHYFCENCQHSFRRHPITGKIEERKKNEKNNC